MSIFHNSNGTSLSEHFKIFYPTNSHLMNTVHSVSDALFGPLCSTEILRTHPVKKKLSLSDQNKAFTLTDKMSVIGVHGGKYFVIFPNRLIWLCICESTYSLLLKLTDECTINSLCKLYPDVELKELSELLLALNQLGIISYTVEAYQLRNRHPFGVKRIKEDDLNRSLQISITQKCNFSCLHCMVSSYQGWRNKSYLELSDIKTYFENNLKKHHKTSVTLQGGEPLLHPNFKELVEYLSSINVVANIYTNAWFVTENLLTFLDQHNANIVFSLDGSEHIHDSIRKKGSHAKIISALQATRSLPNLRVGISFCATKLNIQQLGYIYETAYDYSVNNLHIYRTHNLGHAKKNKIGYLPLLKLLNTEHRLEKKYPINCLIDHDLAYWRTVVEQRRFSRHCGFGHKTKYYIEADGSIFPCQLSFKQDYSLGNICDPELKRSYHETTSIPIECNCCEIRYWCLGGCRFDTPPSKKEFCTDMRESIFFIMKTIISDSRDF